MNYRQVDLGFSTADGEQMRLAFDGADLTLSFHDWRGQPVAAVFRDVLAFRWGQEVSADVPRDDIAYEILGSPELGRELQLNGLTDAVGYAHYKLCFNACGVLDVMCRHIS